MRKVVIGIRLGGCLVALASATDAHAQENKLALDLSVLGRYDSNILRTNDRRSQGPRDNQSVTPRVVVNLDRNFGRQHVFLSGTAGYVYNSRFRFLDREEINLNGGASLKFGGRCRADLGTSYFRAQSDLEDLGGPIRNTVAVQDYSLAVECPRSAGLYPKITASYARTSNSLTRRERDQDVVGGRASLVYTKPSLGGLEAFFEYSRINRPNRVGANDVPFQDLTEVTTWGARYQRSLGVLTFDANIGRTHANPKSALVAGFTGLTFGSSLTYQRSNLGSIRVRAERSVSARGNVGSSFYISDEVGASIRRQFSPRTSAGANVSYGKRTFRGEDNDLFNGPRGRDRLFESSVDARHRLGRRIAVTVAGRYRTRNAQNDLYDYSSTQATVGASISF